LLPRPAMFNKSNPNCQGLIPDL